MCKNKKISKLIEQANELPKISIINYLKEKDSEKNILYLAFSELKDYRDVIQFYYEYLKWAEDEKIEDSIATVNSSIKYLMLSYEDDKKELWHKAMENIKGFWKQFDENTDKWISDERELIKESIEKLMLD